jgi:galactose-1-phosphate uridylyltransferase
MAGCGSVPGEHHSQLIALPIVPKLPAEEVVGATSISTTKRDVYCDIIRQERDETVRIIEETRRFHRGMSFRSEISI